MRVAEASIRSVICDECDDDDPAMRRRQASRVRIRALDSKPSRDAISIRARAAMAAGLYAGFALRHRSWRRSIDVAHELQTPSAFLIHIIVCAICRVFLRFKNESLRLQGFRPTSALITANEPLI